MKLKEGNKPSTLVDVPPSAISVTYCFAISPSLYTRIVGVFRSGYPSIHMFPRISQNLISPYFAANRLHISDRSRDSTLLLEDEVRFKQTTQFFDASVTSRVKSGFCRP